MTKFILKALLFFGSPLTFVSAIWLKFVRKAGIGNLNDKILMQVGVLPIIDHYYEPMVNPKKHLAKSLSVDRSLKGIDLNVEEQLTLLSKFNYNQELLKFPIQKVSETEYYYNNDSYASGDSEFLYNIIRFYKPKRIIEIGSGNSTLMVSNAVSANKIEDANYKCNVICVEPYEKPWLEKMNVELKREKVENIDLAYFQNLEANDILFIDSTHVIRPQGDVLFEYLELLPTLKPGVIVHVHDIFTPKDYLSEWVINKHFLWNEQYLLEAFLTHNNQFKIIGALNYLAHNYTKEFGAKCPVFAQQSRREPGAFWMVKK